MLGTDAHDAYDACVAEYPVVDDGVTDFSFFFSCACFFYLMHCCGWTFIFFFFFMALCSCVTPVCFIVGGNYRIRIYVVCRIRFTFEWPTTIIDGGDDRYHMCTKKDNKGE